MRSFVLASLSSLVIFSAVNCNKAADGNSDVDVTAFVARAERVLDSLSTRSQRASWVQENFITDDTEILNAQASRDLAVAVQQLATQAKQYESGSLTAEQKRKLLLLKLSLAAPPPADAAKATELSTLAANLDGMYGKGAYCKPSKADAAKQECRSQQDLSNVLATSRDPVALLDAWKGWHTISVPMRDKYARFVDLSNEGARGLGFADAGALWRSGYDMPPDAFAADMDRVWNQLQPLYKSLHAYTRAKLVEKYGAKEIPPTGPIPAQYLGNMWAQEWGTVYDVVAPKGSVSSVNVAALLKAKKVDQLGMVHYGENFFTSLGFAKLPDTFWKRSLFLMPKDRDVVCHPSAWDIDAREDLRVKMCIEVTGDFFETVHHELGHNFYQRAYNKQPFLFQNGANDGFHEAIGDAIALSITPKYLQQVGLLAQIPPASGDTLLLLQQALNKVAFLPFGLLVDQWRWKVFSGEVKPDSYNKAWWDLKLKYQGVVPPVARTEADFDPGAKYHVASNTPYARYFLARILQFQFYRAMCKEAGHQGPLYTCSFYGSKEAGAKLAKMLEAGASKPWQDILFDMTGSRQLDASAMAEYFEPLKVWLDKQNAGKPVGW
ncbi:MAG: M2 family metallopeptidase [Gemmatimonadaceae bacterium]